MNYDEIWEKSCNYKIQQKYEEFIPLLEYLNENCCKNKINALEIGCNTGGTSYAFASICENLISVDLNRFEEWTAIKAEKTNINFQVFDSHSEKFKSFLKSLNVKFDFIMVDGDHTERGAYEDYILACQYLAPGGVIGFHDILDTDYHRKLNCLVTPAWEAAKRDNHYKATEIVCLKKENPNNDKSPFLKNMPEFDNWGGIGVVQLKEKLNLSNVTAVIIDCVNFEQAAKAIETMQGYADFAKIKYFNHIENISGEDVVESIKIDKINNIRDYNEFVIKQLHNYIETDYCMIFQWDGFILNPDAWDNEYLNYDYIGAPWWFHYDKNVGNGGFCIRTKKLMEFVSKLPTPENYTEDVFICRDNYQLLIDNGFKFAPYELAEKFSIENGKWDGQLGFHDFKITNISNWQQQREKTAVCFGDVGDVIYSIPTFRALQVKKIILDTRNVDKHGQRFKMDEPSCRMLRLLLEKQGFKVEVKDNWKIIDVDYEIDDFRMKSGVDLFTTHLGESIGKTFNTEIDMSEKFLEVEPLPIADIVINRSKRYRNINFDYYSLLQNCTDKNIVFLVSKEEYLSFKKLMKLTNIVYYPTVNFYEAAQIIAGAKVFIGNQSACYAIAEGLKVNRIQETCLYVPNCLGQSDNSIDVESSHDLQYAKIELHKWLDLPIPEPQIIPDKVLLYTTCYVGNEYGLNRMQDWINYYSGYKDKFAATHAIAIDDGSPMKWLSKLECVTIHQLTFKQPNEMSMTSLQMPSSAELDEPGVHILRFPDRLGRPSHHLFPGWWRSYSFGSMVANMFEFDKFIFIESDSYIIPNSELWEFIRNRNNEFGSCWCPSSNYREPSIQWCDKSNFYKIQAFWHNRGILKKDFWYRIEQSSYTYLPEFVLPFSNDLSVVKQFKGDRYGDDGFRDFPDNLDFICNVTDISLDMQFHRLENIKTKKLGRILQEQIQADRIRIEIEKIEEKLNQEAVSVSSVWLK